MVARCHEHTVTVKEVGQQLGLEEDAVVRKGNGGGNTGVSNLRPESNMMDWSVSLAKVQWWLCDSVLVFV